MNDYFLSRLASYYYQKYGNEISDFCFVFPGRRAGIFFTNYLTRMSDQPMWSPSVLTINEFVEHLDGRVVADSVLLLFELYEVYCKITPDPLSFEDFMPWGETLLSDFEDVDKYLVDAHKLFSNLLSLKEIETDYSFLSEEQIEAVRSFWSSFNPDKLSEHQQMFIKNWENMFPLYSSLNEALEQKKLSYGGMQMRRLTDGIRAKEDLNIPWKKVVFAGFFVLTPAERMMFQYMKKQGAEFFWDYSSWLLPPVDASSPLSRINLPFNGPDVFLRENIMLFPSPDDWQQPNASHQPDITITGVASQTEQLRVVTDFLESLHPGDQQKADSGQVLDTAVLLTDENLLIPVLHAIPPAFSKINVTLGYPLKNTPIYSLVGAVINLQKNAKQTKQGKTWFYFRDVLPVLQHQYVTAIEPEKALAVKKQMLDFNRIFVEATDLNVSDYLGSIFKKINRSSDFPQYIESILLSTYELIKQRQQSYFEQEFIFSLYKSVVKLGDLLARVEAAINPETWLKLFKRITETQTVAFKGEPLSGLQVMGVLETRALDFENMVILNMNEGVFPKDSAPNSFIPYNLRKGFGLPTIEHQDAIFAYYFFRLIHRAKKVHLVFNSSSQGMQSGEMSRFLYQLIYEFPVRPYLRTAVEQVKLLRVAPVVAHKTPDVMAKLMLYTQLAGKTLSPSALSGYVECPMRFYYKQIAGIEEPDEITEDLDARIFGILFHFCMDELYKPLLKREVKAEEMLAIARDKANIRKVISHAFARNFPDLSGRGDEFGHLQGKNILVAEVLQKYIARFIENEQPYCPLYINGLEEKVAAPFEVSDDLTVFIGGIIDRWDRTGGVCRVMDYKTGSGKNGVAEIAYLFDPHKHSDFKAIFQTLLYSLVIKRDVNPGLLLKPGVVWLKKVFDNEGYDLTIGAGKNKSVLMLDDVEDEFAEKMKEMLAELFDANIPFQQTDDEKKCGYCTYRGLCRR